MGQPVDLNVGTKLTGRAGRWNVGVLGVQQDSYGDVDDSDLFIGRLSSNVFEESSVGMIVTDGDPRSNLDNSVVGADFRYRNTRLPSERRIESTAWYQQSDTEGVETGKSAWGLAVSMPTSEGPYADFQHEVIEENFNPALGFVNRSGCERMPVSGGYRFRPEGRPWLRSNQIWLMASQYDNDVTGELESRALFLRPFHVENHRGDRYSMALRDQTDVLVEPFEISDGIIIPPGEYDIDYTSIDIDMALRRTHSGYGGRARPLILTTASIRRARGRMSIGRANRRRH